MDGPTTGPYTKAEIDQLLAKNEIGRSHIVELPTGDRRRSVNFWINCRLPNRRPHRRPATASIYLAIGSQPQGPYSTQEVTEFIENGSIGDDIQILVEGEDAQKISEIHAFQGILYQAHTRKASIPTAAAQPETAAAEQSRKDITVFVEGQRYGPTQPPRFCRAPGRLIDGDALATRPACQAHAPQQVE